MVTQLAEDLTEEYANDEAALKALLSLTQKIIWAEPPNSSRLMPAVQVRQTVIDRLLPLAELNADESLVRTCKEMLREGQNLKIALRRELAFEDPLGEGSRAWILGRVFHDRDPRMSRTARLLQLEKDAEWAEKLRREHLHVGSAGEE